MLRSLAAILLSLLLASPLAAQNHVQHAASHSGPAVAPSVDSAAGESRISVDDRWEPGTHLHDHVIEGIGPVGGYAWPHRRESSVYRMPAPIRYNRAEGVVVGFRREPMRLGSHKGAQLYGQIGYAFALDDIRYTVGLESQLVRDREHGLKIGVAYQEQTLSPDRWKTSYAENSLASFGFRYDFFDYYESQGISVYAVQALSETAHLTAGFRSEEHRSIARNTGWSLFKAGSFRTNPAVGEGRLQAAFVGLNAGKIRDADDLPRGAALHLEAVVGTPFGGDLHVNRYEADGRIFLPVTHETRLGLRLRGGYATSQAPLQSQFTLGGIGSVRSYDQNALRGTKMVLANAEYIVEGATIFDDFLDDVFVAGLFDAGWVGNPGERFHIEEVVPSIGFSIGIDEREVRLDVTWPLRDIDTAGSGPSIWLRITPNF